MHKVNSPYTLFTKAALSWFVWTIYWE